MSVRIEALIHAASLAQAASDALTIASCGVTPTRRMILQQEAEVALYGAIDLIWQAGSETFAKRIAVLSAEIVAFASPANSDGDLDPTPPAAPVTERIAA